MIHDFLSEIIIETLMHKHSQREFLARLEYILFITSIYCQNNNIITGSHLACITVYLDLRSKYMIQETLDTKDWVTLLPSCHLLPKSSPIEIGDFDWQSRKYITMHSFPLEWNYVLKALCVCKDTQQPQHTKNHTGFGLKRPKTPSINYGWLQIMSGENEREHFWGNSWSAPRRSFMLS